MKLHFPKTFQFGTSTSADQIETAFEHDWQGHQARDGNVFDRTTDHEKRFHEDAALIASVAPNYRTSLMWSKLQRAPRAALDNDICFQYHLFFQDLRARDVNIMLVLHHFSNPKWFAQLGGWENEHNILLWVDYAEKVVKEFGRYVSYWNTFNEPNLYTSMGWVMREFPPYKKNPLLAKKVITNIARAHEIMYTFIKEQYPETQVGISHNCTIFSAHNWLGKLPAWFLDWCFMEYPPTLFKSIDFFGMSYYARIAHDPFPITYLLTPEKIQRLNKPHDDMWEYYPEGLRESISRYWNQYKKPIIITENGICTGDDTKRIKAIQDYLLLVYQAIQDGIDVRGYYHWSTWDNFEWSLGPTYKFGLCECNPSTKARTKKPSANFYTDIAFSKTLTINSNELNPL